MKVKYSKCLGIDIGSTTVKVVVVDKNDICLYKNYVRHYSELFKTVLSMLYEVDKALPNESFKIMITGSGGLGFSSKLQLPFVQEVVALVEAIEKYIPETDVAIELGGEDAKITYLSACSEQRMNGVCAGGTGAFIDQMAQLIHIEIDELNELAKNYDTIYPIASRCGVFAKTDIQPLINEGAALENIAVSIFQAVVNQTISGLACGRPIRGRIAFLGGPLTFLSELRNRFIDSLDLKDDEIVFPENSQYFVALGAAEIAAQKNERTFILKRILEVLDKDNFKNEERELLPPLFKDKLDYEVFRKRHDESKVRKISYKDGDAPFFLGIDAGSTTSKVALIDSTGALVWSCYGSNEGKPLESVVKYLTNLYNEIPNLKIARSGVTGYGEGLLKAALNIDEGEIETIAHFKAADFFCPSVDFILDIGGQDMKCLKVNEGVINNIMLNEACSSGCGSFIETYAQSLSIPVNDFAKMALLSKKPVDLGTRCTVFMNSKIKQAQKDGATVGDISAGISYSVIKNALYKVIKIKNPNDLGKKIVVQGGTFYNEAVLRSFECITGIEVIRPDIAGIMGAFGMALVSKERYEGKKSTLLLKEELNSFKYENDIRRCGLCGNNCLLTITKFTNDKFFVSGNRCERGSGLVKKDKKQLPNLYTYTYKRLFKEYHSLNKLQTIRDVIGIPRGLNIYAHYPLWYTFFTSLGFRVEVSDRSSKKLYESGMESIPSESLCYPAKIVNGHIVNLLKKGVNTIFYPSIPYDIKEQENAENQYNCPIVTSYPEVIENNMEEVKFDAINFIHPFLPIYDERRMAKRLYETLKLYYPDLTRKEIKIALRNGYSALQKYKEDIRKKGRDALNYIHENNLKGVVLAGRPYHIDPEINHGIPEMMNQLGLVVLSEEAVANIPKEASKDKLRVVNQWVYHSRLYNAAEFVKDESNIELVQLISFGCGLDAITSDQVFEILDRYGKIYTSIKIDEINNLGAVRIRVRSLLAAMEEREKKGIMPIKRKEKLSTPTFLKGMKDYTLLCPEMSPIHFQFFPKAFKAHGYNLKVLHNVSKYAINLALQYVNNDACYPALIVIGQILEAIKSGEYNIDKVAILMTQTGGGCRATNYIALLKKALIDSGYPNIPIIPVTAASNLEKSTGFKIGLGFLNRILMAVIYGDVILRILRATRPYEKEKGSTDILYQHWVCKCNKNVYNGKFRQFNDDLKNMIKDFDELARINIKKPKVGVVGEILVKFHPYANNNVVEFLEKEGAEVVVPDLLDFILYSLYSNVFEFAKRLGITSLENSEKDNLSLALGGLQQGVSPLEIARAYSAFANKGNLIENTSIRKIIDSYGNVVYEAKPKNQQVISQEVAYMITNTLEDVVNYGSGKSAALTNRDAAGKTGSTDMIDSSGKVIQDGNKDLWFVGYTPELTAAIWIGYDQSDENHYLCKNFSSNLCANIWRNVISQSLANTPSSTFEKPKNIIKKNINKTTGLPTNTNTGYTDIFIKGLEPKKISPSLFTSNINKGSAIMKNGEIILEWKGPETIYTIYRKTNTGRKEQLGETNSTNFIDSSVPKSRPIEYIVSSPECELTIIYK